MNLGLPVVVDIAISLIFVYFTLSLLSSEIQELLKTLLQWRVYNRNAKLVTMIIALAVAIAANADTFYMLDQFANEKAASASVIQVINKLPAETLEDPEKISDTINQLTATTSLPMGWQPEIIKKQQNNTLFLLKPLPFFIQRVPGWIVTGFAISMGASFWYELLKKFINIKNVGKKPETTENGVVSQ